MTPWWELLFSVPANYILAGLFLWICRRKLVFGALLFPISLLGIPWWIHHHSDEPWGWFPWFKVLSVIITCEYENLLRCTFSKRGHEALHIDCLRHRWAFLVLYIFLILNILEAIAFDLSEGYTFNGLCGLMLAACTPPPHFFHIDDDIRGEYADLLYDTPFGYVFLYTSWNMCFVLNAFTDAAPAHFVILTLACLRGFWHQRPDLWFQARSYTLAFYVIVFAYTDVWDDYKLERLHVDKDSDIIDTIQLWWSVFNFIFGLIFTTWWMYLLKDSPDAGGCLGFGFDRALSRFPSRWKDGAPTNRKLQHFSAPPANLGPPKGSIITIDAPLPQAKELEMQRKAEEDEDVPLSATE